jgi:hypothetical protein
MTAGIALLVLVGGAATAKKPASERVVYVTERYAVQLVEQANVDVDPPGLSLGDEAISRNVLRRGGEKRGALNAVCTFTGIDPNPILTCSAVANIGSDTIALMLRIPPSFLSDPANGTFKAAVTGGTGNYRNARGYAVVGGNSESITFHIIRGN